MLGQGLQQKGWGRGGLGLVASGTCVMGEFYNGLTTTCQEWLGEGWGELILVRDKHEDALNDLL